MGKIVEMFKKLWEDNIKTNYKKISALTGSSLSGILLIVLAYFFDLASEIGSREAQMICGIILILQILGSGLILFVFGNAKNGNGYNVPETKAIVDLIKKDAEFREMAKQKLLEHLNNGSKLLNHGENNG